MPPLGDILFKLGSGEELSPGELNDLRLGVNRIQGLIDHYDLFRYGLNPLDLSSELVLGKMAHCGAKVYRSDDQTIVGGTYDNIEFTDSTGGGWDSDSFWDLDTDAERGTVPYSGIYLAVGYVKWHSDATGWREVNLADNTQNTATYRQYGVPHAEGDVAIAIGMIVSGLFWWEKGDQFFLEVWHNTDSGTLDVDYANLAVIRLTGHLLGAAAGTHTRFGVIDLDASAALASVGYQSHAGKMALSASATIAVIGIIRDGKAAISASATVAAAGEVV